MTWNTRWRPGWKPRAIWWSCPPPAGTNISASVKTGFGQSSASMPPSPSQKNRASRAANSRRSVSTRTCCRPIPRRSGPGSVSDRAGTPKRALWICTLRAGIFGRRARRELLRMQLDVVPDLLLREVEEPGQHDQKEHHLHADPLPDLEVRLGGPHQKRRDILGILFDRHRCAVGVFDALIGQRRRHRDAVAGKVLVVEISGRQRNARGRAVLIALHQSGDVVDALLLILREHVAHPTREAAF